MMVTMDYHGLHHIYPHAYYSSFVKIFDILFGHAGTIRHKRFTITGASGAFGSSMANILKNELYAQTVNLVSYEKDWKYNDYSGLEEIFKDTDILILAHGSKVECAVEANCNSFVAMIQIFSKIKATQDLIVPPEVWALGSEIETHSAWGNPELMVYKDSKMKYMKEAIKFYNQDKFVYRHIVASAFSSKMGSGFISARFAAQWTLFLILRGFRYVPVTYTGLAYLHYFRYLLNI